MQAPRFVAPLAAALILSVCATACQSPRPNRPPETPPAFPEGWTIVDLTRPLDWRSPHLPHPRAFPFERFELESAAGSNWTQAGFTALEQMGTHVAAPAARRPEGATVDQLPSRDSVLPLVVIAAPATLANGALSLAAVHDHELQHGPIPKGALVVLRTGLGSAAPDDPRASGKNAARELAFPGWSVEAVTFLIEERGARAIGTDGPAIDASSAIQEAPAQVVAARQGRFCVAGLGDLATVPMRGAQVVLGALPIVDGSGAPCRVLALVPPRPPTPSPAETTPAVR